MTSINVTAFSPMAIRLLDYDIAREFATTIKEYPHVDHVATLPDMPVAVIYFHASPGPRKAVFGDGLARRAIWRIAKHFGGIGCMVPSSEITDRD